MDDKIRTINLVLKRYFDLHPQSTPVPAKDFMNSFIKAGVFDAEGTRPGKPIRDILRTLDRTKQLARIPYVYTERKSQNTNWFFAPSGKVVAKSQITIPLEKTPKKKATVTKKNRELSDEAYIIHLCDKVLGKKSLKQHRFPFLLGDPGKNGNQVQLPVDAWYPDLNLVIEYHELQHSEDVKLFDKRTTISGVNRKEQRRIYDERRKEEILKQGIKLVILSYVDFSHETRKRLLRSEALDLVVIKSKLKKFL